jgi:hypothetical protein
MPCVIENFFTEEALDGIARRCRELQSVDAVVSLSERELSDLQLSSESRNLDGLRVISFPRKRKNPLCGRVFLWVFFGCLPDR